MEELGISYEKIGPFGDSIEVIDPNGILAKVKAENAEGKYALFCANHIISNRKIFWTMTLDFIVTKKYLSKKWISLTPIVMANHWGNNIVWKIQNHLLAALIKKTGWIPVRTAAGKLKPYEVPMADAQYNAESLKDVEKRGSNIRISPFEDTYMYRSWWQNFIFNGIQERIGKRHTGVASSFARESRFPSMDIIPIYMYENKRGKFYMAVGNPITRKGKTIMQVEFEYLQAMQTLKEQTLSRIADKRSQ